MLDVMHEQEELVTTVSEVAVSGGGQREAAMTRWTTEEDLSNQNILQCKACSLADFTQGMLLKFRMLIPTPDKLLLLIATLNVLIWSFAFPFAI
jgi:hypothetical protein